MSILVATDFSDRNKTAVRTAAHRARERQSALTLLFCLELGLEDPSWRPAVPQEMHREFREGSERKLREFFEETVPDAERPSDVFYRVDFAPPAEGIAAASEERDVELVVVGATGRNRLANFFLGSTSEEVVRRSPKPVLVVPSDAPVQPYDRILAPIDFSPCSRRSLHEATELARQFDAKLFILHALPLPLTDAPVFPTSPPAGWSETYEKNRKAQFDQVLAETDLDEVDWTGIREMGFPADVITDAVEDVDADLIVMGTHGRRGVERFFVGSTATKILRRMPCSIWTLRTSSDEEIEPEKPDSLGDSVSVATN